MITHIPGTSVVIPTYNKPTQAAALVQALLQQQGVQGPLEILVVNDHGEESVYARVKEVASNSAIPVRIFDTGYSGFGVVLARNIGLRFAHYTLCVFLDDDVIIPEDLIARYQQAPDGLRFGRIDFEFEWNGWQFAVRDRRDIMQGPDRLVESYQPYLGYLWSANFAVPTRLGLAIGGFDEVFLDEVEEDMDFGARAILASERLVVVPSARVIHQGPNTVLKKQLGIPYIERPFRGNEHFQNRRHLIANGGLDYWQSEKWEHYRR